MSFSPEKFLMTMLITRLHETAGKSYAAMEWFALIITFAIAVPLRELSYHREKHGKSRRKTGRPR
jgi:hypothetical protein